MIPLGSKALYAFGLLALVGSIAYGMKTDEPTTTVILGFVAFGAWALATAIALAGVDFATVVAPDAPLAEQPPAGAAPARPSIWPLGAALGLSLLAIGAATQGVVQLAALLVLLLVGGGWFVQEWTEHPSYTGVFGRRLQERFLLPFGLPLGVIGLVAIILISISRIFLALPEKGTLVVAMGIALAILISAFAISASKQMARTALMLLTGFALICAIGAGVVGVVHGERTFEKKELNKPYIPAPGQPNPSTTMSPPTSAASSAASAGPPATTTP